MSRMNHQKILEQIKDWKEVPTTLLQRKFRLSYQGAVEIKKQWLELQPKKPTFDELFEAYCRNPTVRKSPPKKRHTPFFINGKILHSWEEAQKELDLIKRNKAC